jgi:ADP-heptose:LPS heptosyltransferase
VFTFVAGPDSVWTRNVARLAPEAQVVSLSQAPPGDFAAHVADYLVQQLKPWPVYEQAVTQILRSVEKRGISTAVTVGDVPVLHPGSGSPHKCWPAERFLELARRLAERGPRPRIVLGEVEAETWPAAQIEAFAAAGELHRPTDLLGLLDSYRNAGVFVGNDSGPGHLAGILGIPTVSLFGPTDPARWRPLGPRVSVMRKSPLEAVEVEAVYEAVRPPAGPLSPVLIHTPADGV